MASSCLPRYPACLPTPSQKCQGNHECPLCPSRERDPLLQGAGFLWWTCSSSQGNRLPLLGLSGHLASLTLGVYFQEFVRQMLPETVEGMGT